MGYFNEVLGSNGGKGGNTTMYIIACMCCMYVSYVAAVALIYFMNKDSFVAANERKDFWGVR